MIQQIQMNEALLPKRHIINGEDLQELSCSICYEVEPQIVRCRGTCKKAFCLHCVTRTKVKRTGCPNRCSAPFQIQHMPGLKIQFRCPFNSQLCLNPINDLEEFRQHTQTCEFMPTQFKQQLQRRNQFVCSKGHRLLFMNEQTYREIYENEQFYTTTLNETCSLCNAQTICSSICRQCSTLERKHVFCNKCRPLPCTKTQCPIGHPYIKKELKDENSIVCDFCGLANSIFGDKTYRDDYCNFDICESCHEKLPELHPLVPLKQARIQVEGKLHFLSKWSKWINLGAIFRRNPN